MRNRKPAITSAREGLRERRAGIASATSPSDLAHGDNINTEDDGKYLNAAQIRHRMASIDTSTALPEEIDVQEKSAQQKNNKALLKELEYLPDPLKLAEHIHYVLRNAQPEKALDLVRLASKDRQCIVAWNHIIDFHMKAGRVSEALKFYNEMKKRAQFPDAHTYTLLLRGLVGVQDYGKKTLVREEFVSKAVSLYHSMSSPTSRVSPSIIHTNAALQVCALGGDMDAFWGIASKIPERGAGVADHRTYSIILNGIRHEALRTINDEGEDEKEMGRGDAVKRDKAISEGRKVWQEVVGKWRSGQVKLDEELVCAMARVLLLSERLVEWDDVLSLIRQTMNIDRLIAPLGEEGRRTGHVPQLPAPAYQSTGVVAKDAEGEQPGMSQEEKEIHDGWTDSPAAKAFKPVQPLPKDPAHPQRPTALSYVKPGNDTLSVLIEACARMRTPKTALAYWTLFTSPSTNPFDESAQAGYDLKPDLQNFHSLLRLLGKSRASARAAHILKADLPSSSLQPRNLTFRLAMEVCQRDWKNEHALAHATSILGVMEDTLPDLDVQTLKKYLSLALQTDSGPRIEAAVERLDGSVHNLKSLLTFGGEKGPVEGEEKREVEGFFRTIIGAIDTLMNRGLVEREKFAYWHARRSQLNQIVARMRGREERSAARGTRDGGFRARDEDERGRFGQVKWDKKKVEGKFRPRNEDQRALGRFKWNGFKADRERKAGAWGVKEGGRREAGARAERESGKRMTGAWGGGGRGFADSPADLA